MIKSTTIILLSILFSPFVTLAQKSTFIGVEIGPKYDIYDYTDNTDRLYTKPFFYSPAYGLTIGQELNKTITLETGIYFNDYGESYIIEGDIGYGATNAIFVTQIPLRLKANLQLLKDKLNLVGTVGYTFSFNSSGGTGTGSFTSISPFNGDTLNSSYTSNYDLKSAYGLFETGLALELQFRNSSRLYLAANYLVGSSRVVESEVTYSYNSEPEQRGTVFSYGNYYSIVVGYKYPTSKFWAKNEGD